VAKKINKVIGRKKELEILTTAIGIQRNILIEGPVGVGKTFLVREVLSKLGLSYERVDGDTRYTESKLTGWFDPPLVLKKGYVESCFIEGPLLTAMRKGRVLFINELNRMPESVQNILLPAMDERHITIPKLGRVDAKPGFLVIATQNPKEFSATHLLSEALLDRFEMISIGYQSREEEMEIGQTESSEKIKKVTLERVIDLVRATRSHPSIKRGASIRAALAILKLIEGGMGLEEASLIALPSRIEMVSSDEDPRQVIQDLLANHPFPQLQEKKNQLKL
jgi:MoxR-like ATPase